MFQELIDLWKAKSHKYTHKKRVYIKGKPSWRYYYKEHHGGGVTKVDELHVGEAFKVNYKGKEGHFHIQEIKGDKVKVVHDETGKETTLTRAELKAVLKSTHSQALKENVKKKEQSLKDAKSKLHKINAKRRLEQAKKKLGEEAPMKEEKQKKSSVQKQADREIKSILKDTKKAMKGFIRAKEKEKVDQVLQQYEEDLKEIYANDTSVDFDKKVYEGKALTRNPKTKKMERKGEDLHIHTLKTDALRVPSYLDLDIRADSIGLTLNKEFEQTSIDQTSLRFGLYNRLEAFNFELNAPSAKEDSDLSLLQKQLIKTFIDQHKDSINEFLDSLPDTAEEFNKHVQTNRSAFVQKSTEVKTKIKEKIDRDREERHPRNSAGNQLGLDYTSIYVEKDGVDLKSVEREAKSFLEVYQEEQAEKKAEEKARQKREREEEKARQALKLRQEKEKLKQEKMRQRREVRVNDAGARALARDYMGQGREGDAEFREALEAGLLTERELEETLKQMSEKQLQDFIKNPDTRVKHRRKAQRHLEDFQAKRAEKQAEKQKSFTKAKEEMNIQTENMDYLNYALEGKSTLIGGLRSDKEYVDTYNEMKDLLGVSSKKITAKSGESEFKVSLFSNQTGRLQLGKNSDNGLIFIDTKTNEFAKVGSEVSNKVDAIVLLNTFKDVMKQVNDRDLNVYSFLDPKNEDVMNIRNTLKDTIQKYEEYPVEKRTLENKIKHAIEINNIQKKQLILEKQIESFKTARDATSKELDFNARELQKEPLSTKDQKALEKVFDRTTVPQSDVRDDLKKVYTSSKGELFATNGHMMTLGKEGTSKETRPDTEKKEFHLIKIGKRMLGEAKENARSLNLSTYQKDSLIRALNVHGKIGDGAVLLEENTINFIDNEGTSYYKMEIEFEAVEPVKIDANYLKTALSAGSKDKGAVIHTSRSTTPIAIETDLAESIIMPRRL